MSSSEERPECAETVNLFWQTFNAKVASLREEVARLGADFDQERATAAKRETNSLQRYATVSTRILPPYDIRRSQEIIESINKDIKTLESTLGKKPKFSFGDRKKMAKAAAENSTNNNNTNTVSNTSLESAKASEDAAPSLLPPGSYELSNKTGETISLRERPLVEGAVEGRIQLFLKNNTKCNMTLAWMIGSVRIENTNESTIYLGPCMTSVYLENVSKCTIYIACHQLRIHNCSDCQLYVRVQSHPIIEDCQRMGFAPYSFEYPGINDDFRVAGLQQASCWNNVIDFRWHKSTPSPHWHEIQESERLAPVVLE